MALTREFLARITNQALAERLSSIADNPRSWHREEKQELLHEAARRLDPYIGIRPKVPRGSKTND